MVAARDSAARHPRTDPDERDYRTGLPYRVMTSNPESGQECRRFGLGNRRTAIRNIRTIND
jgi:hypothetical protein